MDILIQVSQFILSLSLLIVLHELGHYIPAKLFKIKVEKFYLFFDVKFSLFKKKIGDTVWGIGWLPLGGYCKIAGMIDESMDKEQMAKPPQPWEYRSRPAWQRLIVILGGVTVNFLLAWLIYIALTYSYGTSKVPLASINGGFEINEPALIEAGFKNGDKIIAVDGKQIMTLNELDPLVITAKDFTVDRGGEIINISLPENFLCNLIETRDVSEEKKPFFSLREPFIIKSVIDGSPNENFDLRKGDVIVSINNDKVQYRDEVMKMLPIFKNQTIEAEILREGLISKQTLNVDENGMLGIMVGIDLDPDNFKSKEEFKNYNKQIEKILEQESTTEIKTDYTILESISMGSAIFSSQISGYFDQLAIIFNPNKCGYKAIGGFGTIMSIFPDTWNWAEFWSLTAFLSLMLAILNLLPIPALDGGHAMFLIYEIISGKKPSDKFMEKVQLIGFLILISLVILANGNDIYNFLIK